MSRLEAVTGGAWVLCGVLAVLFGSIPLLLGAWVLCLVWVNVPGPVSVDLEGEA